MRSSLKNNKNTHACYSQRRETVWARADVVTGAMLIKFLRCFFTSDESLVLFSLFSESHGCNRHTSLTTRTGKAWFCAIPHGRPQPQDRACKHALRLFLLACHELKPWSRFCGIYECASLLVFVKVGEWPLAPVTR